MTAWTQQLAELINDFADTQVKTAKDAINSKQPVAVGALRTVFRQLSGNAVRYRKICETLGINSGAGYDKNVAHIAAWARANGSTAAADKLEKSQQALEKANAGPHKSGWKNLKANKQKNIQL